MTKNASIISYVKSNTTSWKFGSVSFWASVVYLLLMSCLMCWQMWWSLGCQRMTWKGNHDDVTKATKISKSAESVLQVSSSLHTELATVQLFIELRSNVWVYCWVTSCFDWSWGWKKRGLPVHSWSLSAPIVCAYRFFKNRVSCLPRPHSKALLVLQSQSWENSFIAYFSGGVYPRMHCNKLILL